MRSIVISLLFLSLLSSCATIFSKSKDKVTFKSEPSGADVYIDGDKVGTTPFTKEFKRSTFNKHYITIKKDGFDSQKFQLKKTVSGVALFNCTSFLSWGTDALTGHLLEYQPHSYFIDLKRKGTSMSSPKAELIKFVLLNQRKILSNLVQGRGEVLKSYAKLMGVSDSQFPTFRRVLAQNLPKLIQYNEPDAFQVRVQELLVDKRVKLSAIHPQIQ